MTLTSGEVSQTWVFTFRWEQVDPQTGADMSSCYTTMVGTKQGARLKMIARYGKHWAYQYPDKEAAGVKKWGLKKVEP